MLRGAAQLRTTPGAAFGIKEYYVLMQQSALQPDWSDWATILWSLIDLDRADVAIEAVQARARSRQSNRRVTAE